MVKQTVYIGVIDPLESKSGLIFELGLLLPCHFSLFVVNSENSVKLVGGIANEIRPCPLGWDGQDPP